MVDLIALGGQVNLDVDSTQREPRFELEEVDLLAPLVPRKNVFAVGRNYAAHVTEIDSTRTPPSHPIFFSKPPTSIIGPGEAIVAANDPTDSTDYEGELAVIIGKPSRRVEPDRVWDHIFGYTILNDVTARVLQTRHTQWLMGKGIDTFCPMGPCVSTADEVRDAGELLLTTSVNGEQRQKAYVSEMIFDIPSLVASLSSVMTLEPGDVIATGTPAGVGSGFEPPRYLRPGDLVEVTVDAIGTLSNPVV